MLILRFFISVIFVHFNISAIRFILIAALFFAGAEAAFATNLLSNGSFETTAADFVSQGTMNSSGKSYFIDDLAGSELTDDIDNWIAVNNGSAPRWAKGDCTPTCTPLAMQDGSFAAAFRGNGDANRFYQSFTTVAGTNYTVSYYINPPAILSDLEKITTKICDSSYNCATPITTHTATAATANAWNSASFTFTADSTTTVITFSRVGSNAGLNTLIDNVSVVENTVLPPAFTTTKAVYPYDPGNQNLKMIPGQNIVFEWGMKNTGGPPDAGSMKIDISVPSEIAFKIGSLTFEDGTIVSSGANGAGREPSLTGDTTPGNTGVTVGSGQIDYSNVGTGSGWGYNPSADFTDGAGSYDNDVRAIRVTPTGTMNDGTTAPHVGFRVYYQGQVK